MDRFWAKVDGRGTFGCWEWTGALDTNDYGAFRLNGKKVGAHRVAWIITHGKIEDGLWVLHHCDNPRCVNPTHLFLGTRSVNMKDAYQKGRLDVPYAQGTDANNAKLSEADVHEIRARFFRGETQLAISQDFPVGRRAISHIVCRECWTHI